MADDEQDRGEHAPTDDDFWFEDEDAERGPGPQVSPKVLAIGAAVIVVLLVAFLLTRGSDDDDGGTATDGGNGSAVTQPQEGGGDGEGDAKTCIAWPAAVDTKFKAPAVADEPGVHIWTDIDGWHVRRVPGADVAGIVVKVTTTSPDNPPIAGTGDGGATSVLEGATVTLTLPKAEAVANATFKIPFYANDVVFEVLDDAGARVPTTAFTQGNGEAAPGANPLLVTREKNPC